MGYKTLKICYTQYTEFSAYIILINGGMFMRASLTRRMLDVSLFQTCPEVFRMDDEGLAEVYTDPIPVEVEDAAQEAADNCPTGVITVE